MRSVIAVIVLLAGSLTLDVEAADNRNGAMWYGRAFEIAPAMTPAQWDMVNRYRANPTGPPPAELRQLLGRFNGAMSHARRGARQRYSSYQLDYAQGYELELPHLQQMRTLARMMHADAMVRLHDGDTTGAVDRIASMYRMGGHTGEDRIVISSLVGQSIWSTGDQALQSAIDRGVLDPSEAAVVLGAAEALPSGDPFSYVEATVMEYDLAVQTISGHEDEDGLVHLEQLLPEGTQVPGAMAIMTAEELDGQFELYGQYIDEVVEVFVENDPEQGPEALAALEQRLGDGEFGDFARLFAPAMSTVFKRKTEIDRQLAERLAMLQGLAAGEVGARTQANAAVWYLKAITLLHAKSVEELAALRRDEPSPEQPLEADVIALLVESDEIVEVLREASTIERCDFAYAHERLNAPALAPTYATGLRDLLGLIMVDVRVREDAGDAAALLDRLRIAWSMVRHFQSDPMFTTSITTHQAFNRLIALTMDAVDAGTLTAAQRVELHSLAGRLRRTDPFGYVAATIKTRADLDRHLAGSIDRVAGESDDRRAELDEMVRNMDGDLLVYFAAILDTMRHAGAGDLDSHKASLTPLRGVFDLDALELARTEVPQVVPLLSELDLESIAKRAIPDIASIARRLGEARRDLREGLQTLRPPAAAATGATPAAKAVEGANGR